jgi:large subunit ribosomal protein L15
MDLSNLKPAEGSVKKNVKRIGRGEGSGKGGTSTKGHKGAQSRTGYSKKLGFEGGQMPLQRRVPKFGFTNPNRKEYVGINLDRLQEYASKHNLSEITLDDLRSNNVVKKTDLVKILGRGELSSKLTVKVHAFTKSAKEAIEKAGGSVEAI